MSYLFLLDAHHTAEMYPKSGKESTGQMAIRRPSHVMCEARFKNPTTAQESCIPHVFSQCICLVKQEVLTCLGTLMVQS